MGATVSQNRMNGVPLVDKALIYGEQRICGMRIFLYLFFLIYAGVFHLILMQTNIDRVMPLFTVATAWFALNTALYVILKYNLFRSWMSVGSVFADVATVTAINIATVQLYTLNYADNLVYSLYFIAIALAAIRKKVWVVYSAGILAALSYFCISVYYQRVLHSSGYDALFIYDASAANSQTVASVAFLDQLAKALALAAVSWTVGHVTSKIKTAQKNYITLFNNVPDGIVLTSGTGAIETVNQSLSDMIKEPLPELIGRPVNSLFQSEYIFNRENEAVTQRTSSTSIPVTITESELIPRKYVTQKILSVRNMSVQEDLRQQISLAQKTEALGQIARGLAHDFNNLLGGILGAVSLIKSRLAKLPTTTAHDKLRQHATVIQECAENARDIIKSLLALSRASARSTTSFDVHQHLDELREFIGKAFGDMYKIKLTVELDYPLYIEGDENTVFQALLNICMNARESMPNGGAIQISVREKKPSSVVAMPTYLSMAANAENIQFVEITITDHGHGMDMLTQRQCVDPFFSTKETTRRGIGLGLSIAHTIIRHHNGLMNISSALDKGTTVLVYLPCFPHEERRL